MLEGWKVRSRKAGKLEGEKLESEKLEGGPCK